VTHGATGLPSYDCTIVMTDKSDEHLKAVLAIHITYPSSLLKHLYVTDYTGAKILKYTLPLSDRSRAALKIPTAGVAPVAVSVAGDGTLFYAANAGDFDNVYIVICSPNGGPCSRILSIPSDGESMAADGIAIDSAGTFGYLAYSANAVSGTTVYTTGYVQPFKLKHGVWSLASTPLIDASVSLSTPTVFQGYPMASIFAGGAFDLNGDYVVALPYGLEQTPTRKEEPPSAALFPAGSSTPTYVPLPNVGGSAYPIGTAWAYGSNSTFYILYAPATYTIFGGYVQCTYGGGCMAPATIFANQMNDVGIAGDERGYAYVTSLGMTGGYKNPFPPKYGTQVIYVSSFSGPQAAIFNDSRGKPFQTPWGVAVGP